MVYMGKCEFCGKRNLNPPSSSFFFSCHHGRTIVSCINDDCRLLHSRAVAEHELKTQTFGSYIIYGANREVKIPRSDGSVSNGVIAYEQGLAPSSCIMIRKNNIIFYTEFSEENRPNEVRCKHVSFRDLSFVNTQKLSAAFLHPSLNFSYPTFSNSK